MEIIRERLDLVVDMLCSKPTLYESGYVLKKPRRNLEPRGLLGTVARLVETASEVKDEVEQLMELFEDPEEGEEGDE